MLLFLASISLASATIFDQGYPLYSSGKLQQSTVNAAVADITDLINNNVNADGERFLIPGIMRLVFHDCIDGCDACLDLNAIENTGLESILGFLEPLYQTYSAQMSRADLWVLAASRATDMTIEENNEVICANEGTSCPLTAPMNLVDAFRWGRFDCPGTPNANTGVELPSVTWGNEQTVNYFRDHFGVTAANTVALMGAHANSRARHFSNNAKWTPNLGFNIQYYQNLMDESLEWTQVLNDLGVFEWRSNTGLIALNPDMAMVKDIQIVNATTGESSCTYEECSKASTFGMFKRYAIGQTDWSQHFKNQWLNKVLNNEMLKMPQGN